MKEEAPKITNVKANTQEITWQQKYNINNIFFTPGSKLNKNESYVVKNSNFDLEFGIYGYTDNSFYFSFCSNKPEIHNKILSVAKEMSKLYLLENERSNPIINSYSFNIRPQTKENYKSCIEMIDAVIPFGKTIKKRLFDILDIKAIPDMNKFVKELIVIFHEKGIEASVKKALASEESEPLWQLAQYCEKNQDWQSAIECYQGIIKINDIEYSQKSNRAIAKIITQLFNAADMGQITLTPEEKREYLKQQFSCILNTNDSKEKPWLTRIYNELCGNTTRDLLIPDVNLDVKTLCDAADAMYQLQKENEHLKDKNTALELENKAYKALSSNQERSVIAHNSHGIFSRRKVIEVTEKTSEPTRKRSFSVG